MAELQHFALSLEAPRSIAFRRIAPPEPGPGQVLVETHFSGVSSGTELTQYRGTSPFLNSRWDEERRLFVDAPAEEAQQHFPLVGWGYLQVGRVAAAGPGAPSELLGRLVYAGWGHQTAGTLNAEDAAWRTIPSGVAADEAVMTQMGATALNAVIDAQINVGETVAVFGLGVVGQLVAQLATLSGARVIGVDPIERRRQVASELGLWLSIDPRAARPGEAIKDATMGRGADVCIEASGSTTALAEAIRACAYSSRVVAMGFYQGAALELRLGEEFHLNRIDVMGSQILGQSPATAHRWTMRRLLETFMDMVATGRIRLAPLVSHTVPISEAASVFELLDQRPEETLQTILDFRSPAPSGAVLLPPP